MILDAANRTALCDRALIYLDGKPISGVIYVDTEKGILRRQTITKGPTDVTKTIRELRGVVKVVDPDVLTMAQSTASLGTVITAWMLAPRPAGMPLKNCHLHTFMRARGFEVPEWLSDLLPDTKIEPAPQDLVVAIWRGIREAA